MILLWDINGNLRMIMKFKGVSRLLNERKLYRMKLSPAIKEKSIPEKIIIEFPGKIYRQSLD